MTSSPILWTLALERNGASLSNERYGTNGEVKKVARTRALARQRALSELQRRYPDEYKELYEEEKKVMKGNG